MNLIRIPPDTSSKHLLLMSLILGYQTTPRLRYPAARSIIHAAQKPLETVKDLSKKTAISVRIVGHRSVVPRVSNWLLCSFRVEYLNQESINNAGVVSVVVR